MSSNEERDKKEHIYITGRTHKDHMASKPQLPVKFQTKEWQNLKNTERQQELVSKFHQLEKVITRFLAMRELWLQNGTFKESPEHDVMDKCFLDISVAMHTLHCKLASCHQKINLLIYPLLEDELADQYGITAARKRSHDEMMKGASIIKEENDKKEQPNEPTQISNEQKAVKPTL